MLGLLPCWHASLAGEGAQPDSVLFAASKLQPGENPANYMLDVAGGSAAGAGAKGALDFVQLYQASPPTLDPHALKLCWALAGVVGKGFKCLHACREVLAATHFRPPTHPQPL